MVIEIRMHDSLRRYVSSSSTGILTVDVCDNISVGELLDELEINEAEVGQILVNGNEKGKDFILNDGDWISLFSAKIPLRADISYFSGNSSSGINF